MLRGISVLPLLIAALILRADRRMVGELRNAKAVSIDSAIPLRAPRILGRWRLRRLTGAGAVRMVPSGRYYIDEAGYAVFRKQRRGRAALILSTLLPLLLIMWVWLNMK